ncbi:MAG: GAF domain-containing protein [Rhodothermales bacterium]|nr:GAF domain-containing protein [Rhodothermales bacterium]
MEVPNSQQSRKPRYPWFSFLLPLVIFSMLAAASLRIFGLLDPGAAPYIFSGFVALIGISIAVGVYVSHKLTLLNCQLQDELDGQELLHRDIAARLVVLEEERESYQRSVYESGLEVERRTYGFQKQMEELHEAAALAEEALAESEDRWIRLIENHPEGVVVVSGRRILYLNLAAVNTLGARSAEDIIGTDILRYAPRNIHDQLSAQIDAIENGVTRDPIEFVIIGLDGIQRSVEAFGVQIVFQGKPGVQIVIRDVTTKREAERELRKYAERLAVVNEVEKNILREKRPGQVADHALAHLVRLVPCYRAIVIRFADDAGDTEILACHALTGVSKFQPGTSALPFSTQAEASRIGDSPRHLRSMATQDQLSPLECAFMDEGVNAILEVPLMVKGETVGAMVLGSEDTEGFDDLQVEIVTEIADLVALGLHQHQTERERLSYEIELVAARDHAEEMVRLKTAFLTNMSHEIRTPLTGIIGFAQILVEEIDDEHAEFVNLIEQSGRRLLDTINSVLDLARLESNRMQMTLEPINIVEEAERGVKLLSPLADKKGLWLKFECPHDEVWLELDAAGLDRILNNLIGNAIKFTSTGGVAVRIARDANAVNLIVEDTGIGMSEQFLPQLFEEFRQESSGADRSHEGSGMGLSITRKLVEIMDGTIAVDSKKGMGTTFTVSFPVQKAVVARAPDRPAVRSQAVDVPGSVVLVVADQEEARFLLQYVLHSTFELRLAPDMAVATEIARTTNVGAVLLDIHLGGSQGSMSDVTKFRKTETLASIPIIGMTAYPWPGNREQLMENGYDEYVAKPFEKEIVCGVLDRFVKRADSISGVEGFTDGVNE